MHAASDESPRAEMIEEAISCSICTLHFTERGLRVPRILPCGHTFCSACEKKLTDHKCPMCRRPFGSVDDLPRNFNALQLLARAEAPTPAPAPAEVTELSLWLHECGPEFEHYAPLFFKNGVHSVQDLKNVVDDPSICVELLSALTAKEPTLGAKAKARHDLRERMAALLAQPGAAELYAAKREVVLREREEEAAAAAERAPAEKVAAAAAAAEKAAAEKAAAERAAAERAAAEKAAAEEWKARLVGGMIPSGPKANLAVPDGVGKRLWDAAQNGRVDEVSDFYYIFIVYYISFTRSPSSPQPTHPSPPPPLPSPPPPLSTTPISPSPILKMAGEDLL